jgi:ubiquinone biosynthesis protein UbiJ
MAGMTIDWGVMGSIIVAVAALITALSSKRKAKVLGEVTAVSITEKVIKLADARLQDMVNQMDLVEEDMKECKSELRLLRIEVAALRKENAALRDGVDRLCFQLKSMGQTPVFDPLLICGSMLGNGEAR